MLGADHAGNEKSAYGSAEGSGKDRLEIEHAQEPLEPRWIGAEFVAGVASLDTRHDIPREAVKIAGRRDFVTFEREQLSQRIKVFGIRIHSYFK